MDQVSFLNQLPFVKQYQKIGTFKAVSTEKCGAGGKGKQEPGFQVNANASLAELSAILPGIEKIKNTGDGWQKYAVDSMIEAIGSRINSLRSDVEQARQAALAAEAAKRPCTGLSVSPVVMVELNKAAKVDTIEPLATQGSRQGVCIGENEWHEFELTDPAAQTAMKFTDVLFVRTAVADLTTPTFARHENPKPASVKTIVPLFTLADLQARGELRCAGAANTRCSISVRFTRAEIAAIRQAGGFAVK
ncbi:MAG: hypothetical protein EBQ96_07755 [Proteobacteria bacterium]|nr:hypothetical protein [Pseudomonadota bacterium]